MFKQEISTSNAAFDYAGWEIARTLRILADRVERGFAPTQPDDGPLKDTNGNTVGTWEYTPE